MSKSKSSAIENVWDIASLGASVKLFGYFPGTRAPVRELASERVRNEPELHGMVAGMCMAADRETHATGRACFVSIATWNATQMMYRTVAPKPAPVATHHECGRKLTPAGATSCWFCHS